MKNLIYIGLLFLTACGSSETEFASSEELHAYLNNPDHGFIQSDESSDFLYEAKLVPATSDDPASHFTVQLRIMRLDGGAVLDFNGEDQGKRMEYESYLSFELLQDVYIKSNGQTLSPVFHHYERNYGLKPSIDVFFEFPHLMPKGDAIFCYRDELFGQGLIQLEFDKELFKKCYVAKK